jgi:hypothetical protein
MKNKCLSLSLSLSLTHTHTHTPANAWAGKKRAEHRRNAFARQKKKNTHNKTILSDSIQNTQHTARHSTNPTAGLIRKKEKKKKRLIADSIQNTQHTARHSTNTTAGLIRKKEKKKKRKEKRKGKRFIADSFWTHIAMLYLLSTV